MRLKSALPCAFDTSISGRKLYSPRPVQYSRATFFSFVNDVGLGRNSNPLFTVIRVPRGDNRERERDDSRSQAYKPRSLDIFLSRRRNWGIPIPEDLH